MEETDDLDNKIETLFELFEENIVSWEKDSMSTSRASDDGKKSFMLRPCFKVATETKNYFFFLIDYAEDTFDPNNKGLYMLEVWSESYSEDTPSWQERMCAGISFFLGDD